MRRSWSLVGAASPGQFLSRCASEQRIESDALLLARLSRCTDLGSALSGIVALFKHALFVWAMSNRGSSEDYGPIVVDRADFRQW